MSIPTRDELIERLAVHPLFDVPDHALGDAADFALAEIRRAVADELEALRRWIGPPDVDAPWDAQRQREVIVNQIDARLAALRASQSEAAQRPEGAMRQTEHPLGAATVAEPRTDRAKTCDGAAGSTPAPGATARAGASERTRLRDESPAGNVAAPASSPCPPPAVPVPPRGPCPLPGAIDPEDGVTHDCGEFARGWFARDRRARDDKNPMSDADVLDKAAEVLERLAIERGRADVFPQALREDAAKLRVPKPVDVFTAFSIAMYRSEERLELADHARDWFGSTVAYVQTMAARPCVQPGKDCGFCDSCEARAEMVALSALRRRATEARRG